MLKHRLDEIDILRGLTFLAIVMQHTLASYIYGPDLTYGPAVVSAFLLIAVRYAVPMFIFITGVVLFYNHGEAEFNYWRFLDKRFAQIFVPYFVWTVIYYFWSGGGQPISGLGTIIGDIGKLTLNGAACYHLWFMVAIFQFYLLFPFFRWFILKYQDHPVPTLTLGLIAYIILMWAYTYQVPVLGENTQSPLLQTILAYRDRIFISWFFYFLLGGYVGLYAEKLGSILKHLQKTNIIIYLLTFAITLHQVIRTGHLDPSGNYVMNYQFTLPLTPMMVVFLTSSLLTILYLSQTLFIKYKTTRKVLQFYGRYSFGCYFVHALVLYYINALVKTHLYSLGTISQLTIAFLACAIISLAFCFLVDKLRLPLGNLLLGKISS
jgi:surface polysaccharide O-acyltransferase-like enzyme